MFCDAVVVSFLWLFDFDFDLFILGVIWVIGLAMVCSAFVFSLTPVPCWGCCHCIGSPCNGSLNHDNPTLIHAVLHQRWKFEFGFGAIAVRTLASLAGCDVGRNRLGEGLLDHAVEERLSWLKRWGLP